MIESGTYPSNAEKREGRSQRIQRENEQAIKLIERGIEIKTVAGILRVSSASVCQRLDRNGYTSADRQLARRKAHVRKEVVEKLKVNRKIDQKKDEEAKALQEKGRLLAQISRDHKR